MGLFKKRSEPVESELTSRILETIDALVVVLNPEGKIVMFNHKCQELTGHKESEVKGRVLWEMLIPKRHVAEVKNYHDELLTGHFSAAHANPWLTKDGRERLIQWQSTTIPDKSGKPVWVIATGMDISEQTTQRDEQQRLTLLLNSNPSPVIQLDRQGAITFANQAALQAFNRRKLQGENWRRLCSGSGESGFDRLLRSSSLQTLTIEAKVGGKFLTFDHYSVPDRAAILVFGRDTTGERTRAEKTKEAEAVSGVVVEALPAAVLLLDAKGTFLDCNPSAEKLFGYRRNELAGKNAAKVKLFHQRQVAQLIRMPPARGVSTDEFDVARKDGRRLTVLLTRVALKRDGKPEILMMAQDVSDRKRTTDELNRCREKLQELTQALADKQGSGIRDQGSAPRPPTPDPRSPIDQFETIRQLITRLAHEQHTALSVIRNSTYSLEMALGASPDEKLLNHTHIIGATLDRAAGIVNDFPNRLLLPPPVRTRQTVTSVLEEALGRVVLRESIKLDREVPQDLPGIEIDRSQLVPLLERIITNAQEAMSQGGVLSLKARADNRAVTIGIGDTGIGMNGETRKRIFQPFFTTKPSWIGLGLLLAKETVEANLGRIEFESHPGRGTMFRLRFPATEARSANNGLEPQVNASKRESGKDETTSERNRIGNRQEPGTKN